MLRLAALLALALVLPAAAACPALSLEEALTVAKRAAPDGVSFTRHAGAEARRIVAWVNALPPIGDSAADAVIVGRGRAVPRALVILGLGGCHAESFFVDADDLTRMLGEGA